MSCRERPSRLQRTAAPSGTVRRSVASSLAVGCLVGLPALFGGPRAALAHEGHDGPETGPNDPNAPRRLSEAAMKNGGITLADVAPRPIERVITVPARIAPRPEAIYDVHAPLEGQILEVLAVPGQTVEAGAVVARLGGAPVAAVVAEWDRLRRETQGTGDAVRLLSTLVDREATVALENQRVELIVALATLKSATLDLEAAQQAGAGLPERERRTRAATEAEARARVEGHRARLRAAGLSAEEIGKLESTAADRPAVEILGLDARAGAERFQPLAEHAADLLERRKEAASTASSLQAATLRIRLTGLALDDLDAVAAGRAEASIPLRTPAAGIVRSLSVNRGHWVAAGAEILVLVDPHAIQVEADVPEGEFGRVKKDDVVRVRRGGRPDLLLTGRVRSVAPAVDPSTRRFRAIVDLDSATAEVPIDLAVDASIVVMRLDEAKSIPVGAVIAEGAERYVFKLKDGALVRTPIVVGERDDRFVHVVEGLYSGEKVVATGAELVRDTPPTPPPPKPAESKTPPK